MLQPFFRRLVSLGTLLCLTWATFGVASALGPSSLVYVGTYTGPKSKGIYLTRFDAVTGSLGKAELAAETRNPSFLAVDRKQRCLYAVNEIDDFEGKPSGAVSAFRIEAATGQLTPLNQQPSGGTGPCHISLDAAGKAVLLANYGSGSIAALPILPDGSLGKATAVIQHHGSSINPQRQAGPHAHYITTDPANRFALACDLGLDQILVYRFDGKTIGLTPNDPPFASVKPGAGPRHLVFHPKGRFVYVINEMGSTLTAMTYDARHGSLKENQTLSTLPTLPADFRGNNSCAEVQIHPNGKFVYGSNRGHDSIVVFAADSKTGKLSYVENQPTRGKTPRHFAIEPSGKWLLAENQGSDNIVVFSVDPATGRLAVNSQVEVGSPVCAVFVRANR